MRGMQQAFILGAGLGTRLRPLTHHLPKPLVPLFHRPLAEWALEACHRAGLRRFAVNTHHLPACWHEFGDEDAGNPCPPAGANGLPAVARSWHGCPLALYHEPDLLETGGGLKNIAAWIGNEPLLVHNGDIFSTLPLDRLVAGHEESGLPVTLAVRSTGDARHIALDASATRVRDIRGKLGHADGSHVFTGIYCVNPEFLDMLPPGEKVSVIPAFLKLAASGRLGAVVLDDGLWLDLGDRSSYLEAHRTLALDLPVHPEARVSPTAVVEHSVVGPHAVVEGGAVVRNSVLWPGARVSSGAELDRCILCSTDPVSGSHRDEDL